MGTGDRARRRARAQLDRRRGAVAARPARPAAELSRRRASRCSRGRRWPTSTARWRRWTRVRPSSRGVRADAARPRAARSTLAVLLPNSFGSALAAWQAGMPERWGYATDGRGPLLTRRARVPPTVRGRSQVYYYRAMLAGGRSARRRRHPTRASTARGTGASRGDALLGARRALDRAQPGRPSTGPPSAGCRSATPPWATRLARRTGARVAILGGGRRARCWPRPSPAACASPARVLCGRDQPPGPGWACCRAARASWSPTTRAPCTWRRRWARRWWPSSAPPTGARRRPCGERPASCASPSTARPAGCASARSTIAA